MVFFNISKYKDKIINIFFLGFVQITNIVIPFIIYSYIIKIIGIRKFGLLMFAQSFVVLFQIFMDFGFNTVATREIAIYKENTLMRNKIISSVMLIKGIIIIISIFLLLILALLYNKVMLNFLLFMFVFLSVVMNSVFPLWFFQGLEFMYKISILNFISKIMFLFLVILFIHKEGDYYYVPFFNFISMFFINIFVWIYIKTKFNFFFVFDKQNIKNFFVSAKYVFLSNLFVSFYNSSNTLILGFLTNDYLVGIYASFEKIIIGIKSMYLPIFNALFPWISSKGENEIYIIIKKLFVLLCLFSGFVWVILFMFSGFILDIVYHNNDLIKFIFLFKLFSIVLIVAPLSMLFNFLYLNSIKKFRIRMWIMFFIGLIHILICIFLVHYLLIKGAIIASIMTEFFLFSLGIIIFFIDKKRMKFK